MCKMCSKECAGISGLAPGKSHSRNKDGRPHCEKRVATVDSTVQSTSCMKANSSVPKTYVYTPLDKLEKNNIVNVFGVVKFFKLPYRSKGTDYCSVVTIVDHSDVKLTCLFFSGSQDALPQIFKVGDIVRFHRIKIQEFNKEMQGVNSPGYSALTFDGSPGAPVIPRTASKMFSFTDDDRKTVKALRSWASNHISLTGSSVMLSSVKPSMFFNVTCQLVAKSEVDSSSYLLKVWDGTKCPLLYTKVCVDDEALEGDADLMYQLRNLTVDILVFDNHAQEAKSLKVGSYITIHNLHAKSQAPVSDEGKTQCLEFQLHGGTTYGRGIRVLPESHNDVKELQRRLKFVDPEDYQDLEDISLLELDGDADLESLPVDADQECLPSSSLDRCQQSSATVLTAHQHMKATSLQIIQKSKAPQKYRIRAKLRTFEPQQLTHAVKLHCPSCNSLQDVANEEDLHFIFQNTAVKGPNPSSVNSALFESSEWDTENQGNRKIAAYFVKRNELQDPHETLIMIEGGTLEEIYKLSGQFSCVIPVKSAKGQLYLPDPAIPFLVKGKHCFYGCKQCSCPITLEGLCALNGKDYQDPALIGKAIGIIPLQYVIIMKFTFMDGSGKLDAYLWQHSEQFFQVQASEVLMDDMISERLQMIMNRLCPSKTNLTDNPWLECCIKSYNVKDGMKTRVCYQIFDTVVAEDT